MTPREFVQNGRNEHMKGGVHLGLFALAVACAGYNAVAYHVRRDTHLLVNATIYSALTVLELYQVARHVRKDHA